MKRTYTRRILRAAGMLLLAGFVLAFLVTLYLHWRVHRYDMLVAEAGREYGVDPGLVMAVIRRESRFDPGAVGGAGEKGLMQVTAPAAQEWAEATGVDSFVIEDLFVPEINIHAGTWYLSRAVRYWSDKADPLPYALAEYNAGRSNTKRWAQKDDGDRIVFIDSITYPSTRRYIKDVLGYYCADSNCISYKRR